jgi:hypothetical protein
MIVRVTFTDDSIMLFGDSYKPWKMQLDEYLWIAKRNTGKSLEITKVESSKSKWISWGGLKWCPHEKFQKELNREGCQSTDPDNPSPRQYNLMHFTEDYKTKSEVLAIIKEVS